MSVMSMAGSYASDVAATWQRRGMAHLQMVFRHVEEEVGALRGSVRVAPPAVLREEGGVVVLVRVLLRAWDNTAIKGRTQTRSDSDNVFPGENSHPKE